VRSFNVRTYKIGDPFVSVSLLLVFIPRKSSFEHHLFSFGQSIIDTEALFGNQNINK
jgi:hypothetical protein